jgi:hypothetical protein
MTDQAAPAKSSRKSMIYGAGALVVAALVAGVVLPAEMGMDPLGTGKLLGLSGMADEPGSAELARGAKRSGVITLHDPLSGGPAALTGADLRHDNWEYQLAPFEAIEFKYTLEKGASMEFSWVATGTVKYDMHAHPFEGGTALTESYGQGAAPRMDGKYVAAFTGIHGWFWENRTSDTVVVKLDAAGGMTESTIFQGSVAEKRALAPALPVGQ